jgi:hypothetical protein
MSYLIDFLGGRKGYPEAILFVQTQTVTVANTTTETTLLGTGVGSLILPANFLIAGRSIRVRGFGYHSSTGNPTVTIRFKLGTTTVGTITGAGGNGTNDGFEFDGILTCRTTGASGTVQAQGKYQELHPAGLIEGGGNTSTTTLDTTINNQLNITFQWGTASASNTISLTNFILERLY